MSKSSYPGNIDSDVELPRVDNNVTEIGGDAINSIRDAIFAIQKTVGVNPQGNLANLVSRINKVIDENGIIRQEALSQRGLVTLPIVDSQISDDARIQESKLDLNIPTTTLNNTISSNRLDLDTLRLAFDGFVAQTLRHFAGVSDRHDGYQIDLTNPIRSSSNVETILNIINNEFTSHIQSQAGAHQASGISVNDEFQNFSAEDVQQALIELDALGEGQLEIHGDAFHLNSSSLNRRGEQGTQGNLAETTLATTIFQTEQTKATSIVQVMRPNVARVTSSNLIDLGSLETGVAQNLRIQAGGVDRSPIDINLAAIIPTDDINEVVRAINIAAQQCEEHYPISAYNTGGKITIAHNIPGDEFTIQILDTVQFSAASALGFGNVVGTTITWPKNSHVALAGGKVIRDLKPLVRKLGHVHTNRPTNTIALGLGDLSEFGLNIGNEGRVLVNITNHDTTPFENGTHYIIGYPNNQTFVLSRDIPNGTFDIEIMGDSVNFENTVNGEVWDIFVEHDSDGYGVVTKSRHLAYGPIPGVNIKAITDNFPVNNVEWQVSNASQIQIFENNEGGVPTTIPTGYIGELIVFARDNVNSALIEVTGAPSDAKQSIDVDIFGGFLDDNKYHVASAHYSGNFGLTDVRFITDKRLLGGSPENKSNDTLEPVGLVNSLKDIRSNGVIRGFEVENTDGNQIIVKGGRALINGKIIDVPTKAVTVTDFGAANRLLLLDENGNYVVKSEFDSGFSFEDLTLGDAYGDNRGVAIITAFATDGGSFDGYFQDRRLQVSNIDKRLVDTQASLNQRMTQIETTVSGSSWGFTEAVANGSEDGYLASIETGRNNGFTILDARGFLGDSSLITTRRFEFSDIDSSKTSIFKPVGMTHINVFVEVEYTGNTDGENGPFGTTGTVNIDVGVAVETGSSSIKVNEEYATVKTIAAGILPSNSVTERYVVSIPASQLNLSDNVLFDVVPRVRIQNSTFVTGGSGDPRPTVRFDKLRVVTSSYSIAGNINGEDGSSAPLSALVGDVL